MVGVGVEDEGEVFRRKGWRKKERGRGGSGGRGGVCNVRIANEIILIGMISLIVIFAHAPVLSNLMYTKHAQ